MNLFFYFALPVMTIGLMALLFDLHRDSPGPVQDPDAVETPAGLRKLYRWLAITWAVHPLIGLSVVRLLPGDPTFSKTMFLFPAIVVLVALLFGIVAKARFGVSLRAFMEGSLARDSMGWLKGMVIFLGYAAICIAIGVRELD